MSGNPETISFTANIRRLIGEIEMSYMSRIRQWPIPLVRRGLQTDARPVQAACAPYIQTLLRSLRSRGCEAVIRHGGASLTAQQFLVAIFRASRALEQLGVRHGSLLALFAPNRPEALAIRYAGHVLGACTVFLPAPPAAHTRAELLASLAPQLLVVFPETVDLLPASIRLPIASVGFDLPGCVRLDRLAALQSNDDMLSRARADDLAVMTCSDGTDSLPKAKWRDFSSYTALVQGPTDTARRQLINGKLAYLSQALADRTLLGGGTVILEPGFHPASTLAAIEAERITHLFLVEPQLFALMDHPDVVRRDLSSLRVLSHLGAAAPATLRRRARERLGPVTAHAYGAREIAVVSALSPEEHELGLSRRFRTAGRLGKGVEIRFRRADDTPLMVREPALIELRAAAMAGEHCDGRDIEETFRDAWYRSSDLGFPDNDGCLHVLGQASDSARIGRALITPTLLEETLCRLRTLRYAVVIGDVTAPAWIAAVEAWPGQKAEPNACTTALMAAHGPAVAAKVRILPVPWVPLTEQGKPDRAALTRLARLLQGEAV
jgi:fatty-acyl-CoA synthase